MGAPKLRYMLAQVGEEATEVGCCGDGVMDREGLLGAWDAASGVTFIKVLGTHSVVHQLQMARGEAEYVKGAGKVGNNGKYIGEIRCG